MNLSLTTNRLLLSLLLVAPLHGCGARAPEAAPIEASSLDETAIAAEVARLTEAMRDLPGELVVTRSTGPSLDPATFSRLIGAGKVIHVFSDGKVIGYVHATEKAVDEGMPFRVFRQFGGDIVIGPSEQLPEHIIEREGRRNTRSAQASGLSQMNGALWAAGTIAYTIDGAFSNAEQSIIKSAVGTWNDAVDGAAAQVRVRFVPRYSNDGRPYVTFVRSTDPNYCGQSMVGQHSWVFSNWWSHNISINLNCINQPTLHHEMGHTAGLYHEQQRCDRDQYVAVTGSGVDYDRYCGGGAQDYRQYDYLSVMHYSYNQFLFQIAPTGTNFRGTPGQAGSAQRLDTQDVESINQMYSGQRSLPAMGANRFFQIVPQSVTARAVGVPSASLQNGVGLVIWDRGAPDHQWAFISDGNGFFSIRNRATGKCMEDLNFSMSDGGQVAQWDCWGGDNQKWTVAPSSSRAGNFDIINKLSGKSLDVSGNGTANGTPMQQWGYANNDNQRFQLVPVF